MARCPYCKNEITDKNCLYCGTGVRVLIGTLFCSTDNRDAAECAGTLTNRFLIIRGKTKDEIAKSAVAGGFGLIGSLIHDAVDASKDYPFGYYDLREIRKAVFPFYNAKIKKPVAIRFELLDGSDFILQMYGKKYAAAMAADLSNVGVYVENGEGQNAGPFYCAKPFCVTSTIGLRVAPSATFVRLMPGQGIAPPMNPGAQQ